MFFIVLSEFEWLLDSAIYDVQKIVVSVYLKLLAMTGTSSNGIGLCAYMFSLDVISQA